MSTKGQVTETVVRRSVRPIAISILLGAACCSLVLLLLSFVITLYSVPQAAIDPMAVLALIIGGFVSGFCCARLLRQRGLLYGAICGALETIIFLMAGFILQDGGFGIPALLKIVFILLSAMLGGILGVNAKKRRRK